VSPRITSAALAALVGCGFTPGKVPTGGGSSDASMMMDDAAPDAIPDAAMCTGMSAECVGDTLRTCAAAGAMVVEDDCGWGCDASGGRCKEIDPAANAVDTSDLVPEAGLADLTIGNGINIDTGSGEMGTIGNSDSVRIPGQGLFMGIRFSVVNGVGIVKVNSLHVTASLNDPIRFQFTNPIAIVADGPIDIDGVIVVRGPCTDAAGYAGGYAGGTAKGPGAGPGGGDGGAVDKFGGGGGGYGGPGGGGGTLTAAVYVPGGGTYNDDVITLLIGGSGGGGGGGNGVARGGSGGGAIQLVSNTRISFGTNGGINAGGCGAESGPGGGMDAGGGGGAGGTILLEAPIIAMAANAALAVNGGGGGGGDADMTGFVAQPGQLSRNPATGGPGKNDGNGGDGGGGAAANVTKGADGEIVLTKAAGGGGGALGRIRLNTRDDGGLMINGAAVLSPHYTDNPTTCTHGPATVQ